jgi:putative solute:sodium symporter small subunit
MDNEQNRNYWHANVKLILCLLAVWAFVSFGCGILLVDYLNQFRFFGFKLGFWFAQQGSIYVFVMLIVVYIWRMNILDHQYQVDEDRVDAELHHEGDPAPGLPEDKAEVE